MESLPTITVSVTALVAGAGALGGSVLGAAKMLIGYLERRDKAHAEQVADLVADYRQDREQMTETLVEVKVAMVGLSLRVEQMEGSKLHRALGS